MRTHTGLLRLALLSAALLASLSLVVWRQSRALELLRELDRARLSTAITQAQRSELGRRVDYLESRAYVVGEAGARLGLRVPSAHEIVILPLDRPLPSGPQPLAGRSGLTRSPTAP
jgi:hypothetical protein